MDSACFIFSSKDNIIKIIDDWTRYDLFSFSFYDDTDGEEEDLEVKEERHVLNIDDVTVKTLDHLLHGIGITDADRSP